jgi:hypothetical protein
MTKIPLFYEKQRRIVWWFWLIMLSLNGLAWFGIVQQLIQNKPLGNNPLSDEGLVLFAVFIFMLTLFFLSLKLETIITGAGIKVRLWPLHIKYKYFPWDQIASAEIRKYNPIREYGGWGIRSGGKEKGRAYNMSGHYGMQLVFRNGKKLLIGTNKPAAIEKVLHQMRSS